MMHGSTNIKITSVVALRHTTRKVWPYKIAPELPY